jgi:hypothetical protein
MATDRSARTTDAETLAALEARLGDGYDRIEAARRSGRDVTQWEDFWLDLLRQYEAAYDALSHRDAA